MVPLTTQVTDAQANRYVFAQIFNKGSLTKRGPLKAFGYLTRFCSNADCVSGGSATIFLESPLFPRFLESIPLHFINIRTEEFLATLAMRPDSAFCDITHPAKVTMEPELALPSDLDLKPALPIAVGAPTILAQPCLRQVTFTFRINRRSANRRYQRTDRQAVGRAS